jgi:transposase
MQKQYRIRLSDEERATLTTLTRTGSARAYRIRRAQLLLLADRGKTDAQIAEHIGVHARTVSRLRQRADQVGVLAALDDRPRPGATPKLDRAAEAILVATACTEPPDGHARWTTYLLADRLVALEVVDAISPRTVARQLKKTTSSHG